MYTETQLRKLSLRYIILSNHGKNNCSFIINPILSHHTPKNPATFQSLNDSSYKTVDGRCTLGVVFPIHKGRQAHIHCSDSEWSFFTNLVSVTRITIAQIEIEWDLITKT